MSIVGQAKRKRYRCPLCIGEIHPELSADGLPSLWWCTDCEDAYLEADEQDRQDPREEFFVIAGRTFLLQARPF